MAVKKKYASNVLGRGLDDIGTGRGLDALIDTSEVHTEGSSNLNEVEISQIEPNPNQPRREFDQDALLKLHRDLQAARRKADSIGHKLEIYAAEHQSKICMDEVRQRREVSGPDDSIVRIYEPYIKLQTSPKYMGGHMHGRQYHWLFPLIVPIGENELKQLLWALINECRLTDCDKITGIYVRAGLDTDEIRNREEEIYQAMNLLVNKKNLDLLVVAFTCIVENGSLIYMAGEKSYKASGAFPDENHHKVLHKEILSRKLQILPKLTDALED